MIVSPEIAASLHTLGRAKVYGLLFLRGFGIVTLTAANVKQIANGHYGPAFVVGCSISGVWWFNSRNAARSDAPGAWVAYALGAGLGTVTGMWLGSLGR